MQDVCVSFWRGDGIFTDMMLKVADISPTDPLDPEPCQSRMAYKVDRDEVRTLFKLQDAPSVNAFDPDVFWMFTKCWADVSLLVQSGRSRETDESCQGMVQDAYKENSWFAHREYYTSVDFSLVVSATQYFKDQKN